MVLFKIPKSRFILENRRVTAQPSCIHGNIFCAQTKMAEEEKAAVVSATLKLVVVILVTTASEGGECAELKNNVNTSFGQSVAVAQRFLFVSCQVSCF